MTNLSTLAEFDDIRRCMEVFVDGTAEQQFLSFASYQDECRLQWSKAVQEAQRLQRELDSSLRNMADFETKLFHARRLLEMENKARKQAEAERDQLEKKLIAVAEFIQNSEIQSDTREKLDFLKTLPRKRKSATTHFEEKYGGGNDINSTGSFLSDLSVTHSEDDLIDIHASRTWKKHRPSLPKNSGTYIGTKPRTSRVSTERRRSSRYSTQHHHHQYAEINHNDKICATTKVSIPQNGPIKAESIIEAMPSSSRPITPKKLVTTTTTTTATSSGPATTSEEKTTADEYFDAENNVEMRTPSHKKLSPKKHFTPTAPLLQDFSCLKNAANTPSYKSTPTALHQDFSCLKNAANTPSHKNQTIKRSVLRGHVLSTKTFIKSDTCTQCQKKIRFGSLALKCKNCRVCVHQDCKEVLSIACVPASAGGTPTTKRLFLTDYAPPISPMIPAIIVHCVNEIESRGLNEVGLYRLSASEREVKALKEKFLRGKKPQNISHTDVHVLCCCIKDFLRSSLHEPLIPTDLWSDFSYAVQSSSEEQKLTDLDRAINRLPQANRDTLAFLILHFQRIAECPEVKMPLENLARVFGPTIVGYSSPDPDQHAIFTETMTQFQVMDSLTRIRGEYWSQFTQFSDSDYYDRANSVAPPQPPHPSDLTTFYSTPLKSTLRKRERKFYATPPMPNRNLK